MNLPRVGAMILFALAAGSLPAQEPGEKTVDSGIVEQSERRLMQIDVTVRGPAETLAALTAENFGVTVGREDIDEFVLDRVCIDPASIGDLALSRPEFAETAPKLRTLFYFDQTHLTSLGRRRARELAEELIPQLLEGGRSEAMLISAGTRLKVAAEWTSDTDVLIAALAELAEDPSQVLTWADEEDFRVDKMMAAIDRTTELVQNARGAGIKAAAQNTADLMDLKSGLIGSRLQKNQVRANLSQGQDIQLSTEEEIEYARIHARVVARDLSREEASHTAGGLSLFGAALQHLDGYAPPKAVLYFADTVRSNPGDHYIGLVLASENGGDSGGASQQMAGPVRLQTGNYVHEFQDVINLAAEKGVRLYTVQGRGMGDQPQARTRLSSSSGAGRDLFAGTARFKDAESALSGLARETGGKSFLWAADAADIAGRVLDDLSCLFVLSFHAIELKEDRSTPVFIEVDQPGIELQYRPRMIALSQEARDKARLANAFWGGDQDRDQTRILMIPTGFAGGKYTVLVQFAIPGAERAASDWDMGITAVTGTSKAIKASGRVAVNQPGLPLVFEAEMKIKPGAYSFTAVAQDREYDQVVSTKLEGLLPDPDKETLPFVASTVLLQRVPGAFVRGEEAKTTGSLAHGPQHWLRPDRATGILALVCGRKDSGAVTVIRRLEGAGAVSFEPVRLSFDQERCALLVDTVDAGTLTSGRFAYYVGMTRADEIREASFSEFLVVTPDEIAAARMESEGGNEQP